MAEDRVGVRKFSVRAIRSHPEIETKALKRLEVMLRELDHVQGALLRLKAALTNRSMPTSSLASAVMDSRNWTVSLIMSHAYIQRIVAGDDTIAGLKKDHGHVETLAAKAASLGETDAGKELALLSPAIRRAVSFMDAMAKGAKP